MYGILHRRFEQAGENEQERLMLSFDKMFAREKNTALWNLFQMWQEKQSNASSTPTVDEFLYREKLSDTAKKYICWSDVSASDPFDFITRDHANLTSFSNHSDRRLGDHPVQMNAKACAVEYLHCVSTRQPTYYEIRQTYGSINRHFSRLMVPIADEMGKISRLVYAVRIINSSD